MLKVTECEIELIRDMEMIRMIINNIRGGLSVSICKYAKARNKYTGENLGTDSTYLLYFDKNNLYGCC